MTVLRQQEKELVAPIIEANDMIHTSDFYTKNGWDEIARFEEYPVRISLMKNDPAKFGYEYEVMVGNDKTNDLLFCEEYNNFTVALEEIINNVVKFTNILF
jgi:hypothetical protein